MDYAVSMSSENYDLTSSTIALDLGKDGVIGPTSAAIKSERSAKPASSDNKKGKKDSTACKVLKAIIFSVSVLILLALYVILPGKQFIGSPLDFEPVSNVASNVERKKGLLYKNQLPSYS